MRVYVCLLLLPVLATCVSSASVTLYPTTTLCTDLTAAVNILNSTGGTINLAPGTFSGCNNAVDLSAYAVPLTLRGAGRELTFITQLDSLFLSVGFGDTAPKLIESLSIANAIGVLHGFTISPPVTFNDVIMHGGAGPLLGHRGNTTINNCTFRDVRSANTVAIFHTGSGALIVTNTLFSNLSSPAAEVPQPVIQMQDSALIDGCMFENTFEHTEVFVDSVGIVGSRFRVRNSVFVNTDGVSNGFVVNVAQESIEISDCDFIGFHAECAAGCGFIEAVYALSFALTRVRVSNFTVITPGSDTLILLGSSGLSSFTDVEVRNVRTTSSIMTAFESIATFERVLISNFNSTHAGDTTVYVDEFHARDFAVSDLYTPSAVEFIVADNQLFCANCEFTSMTLGSNMLATTSFVAAWGLSELTVSDVSNTEFSLISLGGNKGTNITNAVFHNISCPGGAVLYGDNLHVTGLSLTNCVCGVICVGFNSGSGSATDVYVSQITQPELDGSTYNPYQINVFASTATDLAVTNATFSGMATGILIYGSYDIDLSNTTITNVDIYYDGIEASGTLTMRDGTHVSDIQIVSGSNYFVVANDLVVYDVAVFDGVSHSDYLFSVDHIHVYPPSLPTVEYTLSVLNDPAMIAYVTLGTDSLLSNCYFEFTQLDGSAKVAVADGAKLTIQDSRFAGMNTNAAYCLGECVFTRVKFDECTICVSTNGPITMTDINMTTKHSSLLYQNGAGNGVSISNVTSVGATTVALSLGGTGDMTITDVVVVSARDALILGTTNSAIVSRSHFVDCGDLTLYSITISGCGSVQFSECVFFSNSAANGGAVFCENTASIDFSQCNFTNNMASSDGGAIYLADVYSVYMDGCHLLGNLALGSGGAVATSGSDYLVFTDSVISDNSAGVYGGGIYSQSDDDARLRWCTVARNVAAIGGGLYIEFGVCEIDDGVFRSNTGTVAGSAVCVFTEAACDLTDTQIVDNVGSAAIESVLGGSIIARKCIFDGNEVALSLFAANTTNIRETAFVGHSDTVIDCSGSPLSIDSCVFRANAGETVIEIDDNDGTEITVEGSFIAGNSGTAIGVTRATVSVTDSTLCENDAGAAMCGALGSVVGDYSCISNNTDCAATCTAKDFCVPAGGFYSGPYEGCYECGGVCASGVGYSCVANSSCIDVESGPYGCQCNMGFEPVGSSGSSANLSTCVDVDECVDVDVCTAGQRCVNTVGSFYCECQTGWVGAGSGCVDIDECCDSGSSGSSSSSCSATHNCHGDAVCANTAGSFVCECPENTYGDGVTNCTDCPTGSTASAGSAVTSEDCQCGIELFRLGGVNDTGPCLPCPAGYQLFYVPSACVACAVGSYKTTAGPGLCTACPEGRTTFVAGAADISDCDCDVGTVSSGSDPEAECVVSCLPGQYALGEVCVECDVGSYTNSSGSIVCETCPAHTTTAGPGATNITACECEPGFYRLDNTLDQGCQRLCPPGMKQESADSCTTCPSNSYSDEVNAETCESCPPNAVSPDNSSDVSYCRCPPGYYSVSLEYGTDCLECPIEAKCKGGRRAPVARAGFHPVGGVGEFAECVPKSACAAGGECAEGYTGELCAACDAGYFRLDGKCRPCNNAPGLVMALFFACLLAVCGGLVWFNARERAVNSFVSVAIGLNSLQITAMYGRLDVNWPEAAQKFFDALSLFNFNIELFAPECSAPGASAFWMRWSLAMFMPVFAAFNFAIVFGVGSALSSAGAGLIDTTPRDLAWSCGRALAQLLTIVYLPLAATVLEYFDCVTDGAGRLVLATSRDTLCYDATYWRFIVLALLGVLAYVVGIPAALGSAFVHSKRALGEVEFAIRFGFFVGRYDENYYWYEMVILARKFGMALAFSFLFSTGYFEAGAGLFALLCFYVVHSTLKPYRTRMYNALESVCVASSLGVLLISLTFQAVEAHNTARSVGIVLMLCLNVLAIAVGVVYDCWEYVVGRSETGERALK